MKTYTEISNLLKTLNIKYIPSTIGNRDILIQLNVEQMEFLKNYQKVSPFQFFQPMMMMMIKDQGMSVSQQSRIRQLIHIYKTNIYK